MAVTRLSTDRQFRANHSYLVDIQWNGFKTLRKLEKL